GERHAASSDHAEGRGLTPSPPLSSTSSPFARHLNGFFRVRNTDCGGLGRKLPHVGLMHRLPDVHVLRVGGFPAQVRFQPVEAYVPAGAVASTLADVLEDVDEVEDGGLPVVLGPELEAERVVTPGELED